MKNVGAPNVPRSTDRAVFAASCSLTEGSCANASSFSASKPHVAEHLIDVMREHANSLRGNVGYERRELVAVAAAREHSEAGGREAAGNRGANVVARTDHGGGGVSCGHAEAPGRLEIRTIDYTPGPLFRLTGHRRRR